MHGSRDTNDDGDGTAPDIRPAVDPTAAFPVITAPEAAPADSIPDIPSAASRSDHSMGNQPTLGMRTAVAETDPGSMGDAATARAEIQRKRFRAGDRLLGRYCILGELGQGGMGIVFRCFDETSGIEVALKALPPELSRDSAEMEEIRDNFRLVESLHHPNIAAIKTLERDAETGDYYLVMEYVEGVSLRQWRKRQAALSSITPCCSLEVVVPVLRQIADALDYAHARRIIHRDIKPSNVMISADGKVKVLDFGLASQIQASFSRVSMANFATSGTGPYMAPEQWRGRPQDARTDLYALAVTAYELLTGHLPFEATDQAILRTAVLEEQPPPIEGLPPAVWSAMRRALHKEPTERGSTCAAFVAGIEGLPAPPMVPARSSTSDRNAFQPVAQPVRKLAWLVHMVAWMVREARALLPFLQLACRYALRVAQARMPLFQHAYRHALLAVQHPSGVWDVVQTEQPTVWHVYRTCLLPQAAVSILAAIAWILLLGRQRYGCDYNIAPYLELPVKYVIMLGATALTGLTIHWLTSWFGAENDRRKAMLVAAYSAMPAMAIGVLGVTRPLSYLLPMLGSVYGIVVLYRGLVDLLGCRRGRAIGLAAIAVVAPFFSSLVILIGVEFLLSSAEQISGNILPQYTSRLFTIGRTSESTPRPSSHVQVQRHRATGTELLPEDLAVCVPDDCAVREVSNSRTNLHVVFSAGSVQACTQFFAMMDNTGWMKGAANLTRGEGGIFGTCVYTRQSQQAILTLDGTQRIDLVISPP
ncbi:MAG: serine/threonine protein kinase [Kiritimatiellia bacterium]